MLVLTKPVEREHDAFCSYWERRVEIMPIALVTYDPDWPHAYERSLQRLMTAIDRSHFLGVEHIGSTSVPGLSAKPIIDMLAAVSELTTVDGLVKSIEALGYVTWFGEPGRRSFELRDAKGRATDHLHIVAHNSPNWHEPIRFRDWLRSDPGNRDAYEKLKRQLAAFHDDTRTYSAAKTDFIQSTLHELRASP